MKPDPAIEDIRAVRREISREHGHDPHALGEHYRELEKQYSERLLRHEPTPERRPPAVPTHR